MFRIPFFISVNRMSTKIVSTEFVNAVDGNSTEFINGGMFNKFNASHIQPFKCKSEIGTVG